MSTDPITDMTLVPHPTEERLSESQLIQYRQHQHSLVEWCLAVGKHPDRGNGYAVSTVEKRVFRIDKWFRWLWDQRDGYSMSVSHDDADAFCRELLYSDTTDSEVHRYQKALKMYWKWRDNEHGEDTYDPDVNVSSSGGHSNPADFLTKDERTAIREAALSYGSVPSYSGLAPDERDRWKAHLAQRYDTPKRQITEQEFRRANGFKEPSLVATSLDTGLRPEEVARATVDWIDVGNQLLRIPVEDSVKNTDVWRVSVRSDTAEFLNRWLHERALYDRYDETDALWLTREGNTYGSQSLRYLLEQLFDEASIPTDNRQVSWYTIRHSVGTYMAREEGLAAAQSQLRHKSPKTTFKYDQTPVEDRRNALDRMG